MLPDKIAKPNPKYRARRKHREQFQALLGRIAGRNPILGRPLVAPEIEHGFLFLSDEGRPLSAPGLLEWQARAASGASSARSERLAPAPAGGSEGRPGTAA